MEKSTLYRYLNDFFWELEGFRTRGDLHYDLIHSHYWLSGRVGNWAQDRWDIPHVFMFHTVGAIKNHTVHSEKEPELRITTEKHLAKTCHRILAPTEEEREQLIRHYGISSDTIGVVPCGVNLDLFRPVDKARARHRLGFDHDESIVLYVGRFSPVKGLDRLLAAMTYLQHYQRLRLVVIGGDGRYTPECRKLWTLSKRWDIQDIVTFVGPIEQERLPPYYSAANVLVVPSHYESSGLVALQSLASGTPVVTSRVGAMGSILREGETGHIMTNSAPPSLARGIAAFLSMPSTKSLQPATVRASILGFGWRNVASAMIDEYANALSRHLSASDSSGKASSV